MNQHDNLEGIDKDTLDHQIIETEIVRIGTKEDCSTISKIGDRDYRTLHDSGAGKCFISLEKYKIFPDKFKNKTLWKLHTQVLTIAVGP